MGIKLFFRKLFGSDARIDFYAKIFAALIISTDRLSYEELELVKKVAGLLFTQKSDETYFVSQVMYHLELCVKNELHINQIIRRIDYLNRLHPRWIESVSSEAVALCRTEGDGLQERVIEYIHSLRTPRKTVLERKPSDKEGVATSSQSLLQPPRLRNT